MRISFNISAAEAKGIKNYLKATSPDITPKITAQDIKDLVIGEALGIIRYGSVGDYILREESKQSK